MGDNLVIDLSDLKEIGGSAEELSRRIYAVIERATAQSDVVQLEVPYLSQWDTPGELRGVWLDADARRGDCGPACLAMAVHAMTDYRPTIDEVGDDCGQPRSGPGERYTNHAQLRQGGRAYGLTLVTHSPYTNAPLTVDRIRDSLDAGEPSIALLHYGALHEALVGLNATQNQDGYSGGHWALAVGYGEGCITIHDPDYWGARREDGAFRRVPVAALDAALGAVAPGCSVGYQGLVVKRG